MIKRVQVEFTKYKIQTYARNPEIVTLHYGHRSDKYHCVDDVWMTLDNRWMARTALALEIEDAYQAQLQHNKEVKEARKARKAV